MIKHIMADGRILDSIDGFIVPSTGKAEAAYRILKNVCTSNGDKDHSSSNSIEAYKE